MAGALSESAPRPVSVVRVDGVGEPVADVVNAPLPVVNVEPIGPTSATTTTTIEAPELQSVVVESNQSQVTVPATTSSITATSNGQTTTTTYVRQFASTEAQTELSPPLLLPPPSHAELLSGELRDARRRERRMRRQHRRALQRANGAAVAAASAAAVNGGWAAAAGLPPAAFPAFLRTAAGTIVPPPPPAQCAGATTLSQSGGLGGPVDGALHPPPPHLGLRGLSLGLPFPVPASVSAFGRDAVPKQCCGLGSPPVRWSILGVGVVGLVCAGAGALLGALRATGRDHIAVALLMIGIGVVLVTVSAVAWRVTSRENCGGFFGLTGISGRIPPARPMHPYAAMIYPEFQFRTPPPSYQASMQEYRLRLLLLDRLQPTSSPPPTYRSNAGSCVAGGGTIGPSGAPAVTAALAGTNGTVGRESRPPSYCGHRGSTTGAGSHHLVPSKKDANLVRIVQTESEPVILSGDQTPPVTAVEVLAHL